MGYCWVIMSHLIWIYAIRKFNLFGTFTSPDVLVLLNPIALRKAKIAYNFGLSECNRVKMQKFDSPPPPPPPLSIVFGFSAFDLTYTKHDG